MRGLIGLLILAVSTISAAPPTDESKETQTPQANEKREKAEEAIRESVKDYAEAYNRGDIDAMIAHYAPDAEYIEDTSEVLKGRDAIRKKMEDVFNRHSGRKIELEVGSIQFPRPSMAVEIGTAKITPKDGEPFTDSYRVLHVKRDGQWLMRSVSENTAVMQKAEADPLAPLSWMVGSWRDDTADVDIRNLTSWTANQRFLIRTYFVHEEDQPEMKVSEVIGWDPAERVIRSWVFDSDGGFGEGRWSRKGDDWIVMAKGVLPDGGRGSAVYIIHPVDEFAYKWSATNREVNGESQPDIDDITMVRTDTQPAADASMEQ